MRTDKRSWRKKDSGRRHSDVHRSRSDDLLSIGIELHRVGDLEGAKQKYHQILAGDPRNADALHLFGFAEFQASRFDQAIESLRAAVEIRPENPEFHNNLSLALLANEQIDEGRRHHERALTAGHTDGHGYFHVGVSLLERRKWESAASAIRLGLQMTPASAEGHNYLGVVLEAQSQHAESELFFRKAVELNPRYAEAWNNLGNSLRDQDRIDEAIACYESALRTEPGFAAAYNNLGVAFAKDGRPAEAVRCYESALRLDPQSADALNNLGNACRDLGRHQDSIRFLRQALQLRPDSAEILANVGVSLRQHGEPDIAIGYLRRALVLQPRSPNVHRHLAASLLDCGRLDDAARCLRHLRRLDPEQPLRWLDAAVVCPTVFATRDDMAQFKSALAREIATVAEREFTVRLADLTHVAPHAPFNLQFFDGNIRGLKEAYADLFQPRMSAAHRSTWVDSWRSPAGRPRIGFVVTEGHEEIFIKSMRGVIERLSPRELELVIFCASSGEPSMRTLTARRDLSIIRLPTRLDRMAGTIDSVRCDLLYYWEVGTDVVNYFLPFLRLAPVQVTSWGIQVTSGIRQLDYYVSNNFVEPAGAEGHYTERLVKANSFLTYRERTSHPATVFARDHFPLPGDRHWYVCAQQPGKFHIDFDEMLAAILRLDPEGCAVLTGGQHPPHRRLLAQRFAASIPDVAERVYLLPRLDKPDYLSLLHHADVLLDPPHFGGVNSTYDALSLGKAIVVLPSAFHRGRYTYGCYRRMGIEDCVAVTVDDYARIAVRLACDRDCRNDVEFRLLQASGVLFEDMESVREHERIFLELVNGAAR